MFQQQCARIVDSKIILSNCFTLYLLSATKKQPFLVPVLISRHRRNHSLNGDEPKTLYFWIFMENLKIEISSQNSRKFESNFQVLCFWNAEKNCFCCYFTPTEWGYGSSVCSHMPWDAGNVFFDWFWTNLILGVILQKVDIFWYLSNFVNLMSPN